jgi:hypothetical protein
MRLLEFEDDLTIFSLSGNEIGRFKVTVTPTIFKRTNCYKVVAKSTGNLDDLPCGTEINAYINEKLQTIEQEHYEFIKLPQSQLDRKTLISFDNETNHYIINKIEKSSTNDVKKSNFKIKKNLMDGYISESKNDSKLKIRFLIYFNKFKQKKVQIYYYNA